MRTDFFCFLAFSKKKKPIGQAELARKTEAQKCYVAKPQNTKYSRRDEYVQISDFCHIYLMENKAAVGK